MAGFIIKVVEEIKIIVGKTEKIISFFHSTQYC
jgi:hypothetical protein